MNANIEKKPNYEGDLLSQRMSHKALLAKFFLALSDILL